MIDLKFTRHDKRGLTRVVVSNGTSCPFTTTVQMQDEAARNQAVERIHAKFPSTDRESIVEALEAEAARDEQPPDKTADAILKLLSQPGQLRLFHSPEGEPFALVRVAVKSGDPARHETLRIRSQPFRDWLSRAAFLAGFKALSTDTLQTVTNHLAAQAQFDCPTMPVFVRVGEADGTVILDLANDEREMVAVTRDGWAIIRAEDAPVRMVRSRGMLPLPRPERGDPKEAPSRIAELRRFLNLDDRQWILIRGFVIGMLRPRGPYAALVLTAEHGCGKSWTAEVLRELVDPNVANNRRPPKDERDLAIAARNALVLSLNNLSGLQPWLSDAICTLLDGAGWATRELYANADEVLFTGARPAILNGIEDVATRPDLADRAVHVALRRMDEAKLKEEDDLRAEFREARPRILGALLDAVACALRRHDQVQLERKPRRLDFARWVEAAAPALGLGPGEFLSAYIENRQGASAAALESSPFAFAVFELVSRLGEWTGSAAELLEAVTSSECEVIRGWPGSPRKVLAILRTYAPSLRANGIDLQEEGRDPVFRRTTYRLRMIEAQPSGSSGSSDGGPEQFARDPKHPEDVAGTRREDQGS